MQPIVYSLVGAAVVGLIVFFYFLLREMQTVSRTNLQNAQASLAVAKLITETSEEFRAAYVTIEKGFEDGRRDAIKFLDSEIVKNAQKALDVFIKYGPPISLHLLTLNATMKQFTEVVLAPPEPQARTLPPFMATPKAAKVPAEPDSGGIAYDEGTMADMLSAELMRRQGFPITERAEDAPAPEQIVHSDS